MSECQNQVWQSKEFDVHYVSFWYSILNIVIIFKYSFKDIPHGKHCKIKSNQIVLHIKDASIFTGIWLDDNVQYLILKWCPNKH